MSERSVAQVPAMFSGLTEMLRRGRGGATAPASAASAQGDTDDRLVALFKNRAELKKAFSDLRAECDALRERLEQASSDPAQDQHRLAALEQRLSERDTAYPALVFFQLRGLWRFCHNQLLEFSEQLSEQHAERERRQREEAFRAATQKALVVQDERIALVGAELARQQKSAAEAKTALDAARGFWNHFRRRRLRERLAEQAERVAQTQARLGQLKVEREAKASEEPPVMNGLGVESMRNVNLAVLAFAQYLYIEFSPNSLGQLSHEAVNSNVNEAHYGTRRDCEALMELIERATHRMAEKRGYGDELKLRARYLKRRATFAGDSATVPEAAALADFPLEFHDGHAGLQVDVNVLEEDYWNVGEVLLQSDA